MTITQKKLSKANEKLDQAYASYQVQSKRANATKEELDAVRKNIEVLKADIGKASFNDQEKKIGDLDKLLSKENLLKMRFELLSGMNKEISEALNEAGKAYELDKEANDKEKTALHAQDKKLEKEYDDASEAIRIKLIECDEGIPLFENRVVKILFDLGWTDEQMKAFASKYHMHIYLPSRN